MRGALLPGTFDPPTLGHWDIIQRASRLFDRLYVAIAENAAKSQAVFSSAERKELLEMLCKGLPNCQIIIWDGLIVDLVEELEVKTLVRGLRSAADFEIESAYAQMNKAMTGVETLFLAADGRYRGIQAALVREIGSRGRKLDLFVPAIIEEPVRERLSRLSL